MPETHLKTDRTNCITKGKEATMKKEGNQCDLGKKWITDAAEKSHGLEELGGGGVNAKEHTRECIRQTFPQSHWLGR